MGIKPMTYEEAARILDPETNLEALRAYAGDCEARQAAIVEACRMGWNEHTDFVRNGACIAGRHYLRGVFLGDYDCVLHPGSMVKNFCMCKEHYGISAKQAGF